MFKILTRKPLWVNVVAGILIVMVLLLLFLGSLALITQHGKTMKIPLVTGIPFAEAKKTLEAQGFEVQVQDSVYADTLPPLQVMKQFPEADNQVKVNRTVYLTINRAVAPFIEMPNLVSMSFRNADMVLRQYGLKLEDTVFKPDFARNSVLDQLYKGMNIKPGAQIQQGSAITLVLGNGIGGMEFDVPDLSGLTYQQARALLDSAHLIAGAIVINRDVQDTAGAYVYSQMPKPLNSSKKANHIHQGESMDVWLSVEKPEPKPDSTAGQGN